MAITVKNSGGKSFAPHPETEGFIRAVIVDVTELKTMQTKFGDKEVFKLVYETEYVDENGRHGIVWSPPYTPSLNEKASLRKDLKRIRGVDITAEESREMDIEATLLGFPVKVMIEHTKVGDRVFAQILNIRPDAGETPYKPCGEYVRQCDRQEGGGSTYRPASAAPEDDAKEGDWMKCKVHVGKFANIPLGDIPNEAKDNLHDVWIPTLENKKPDANDRRLKAALLAYKQELATTDPRDIEDNQPF
jgi:hypothetical protein